MSVPVSEREQLWRERIEWQQNSEISVAEFCEMEGVSTAAFYQWRKRLNQQRLAVGRGFGDKSANSETAMFVPVSVRTSDVPVLRIELPQQIVLQVPLSISHSHLTDVVRAAIAAVEASAC